MSVRVYQSNMQCFTGQLKKFNWVCAPRHQSSQAYLNRVFAENPEPSLSLPDGPVSPPKWLEYVYRTAHPVLRWLPTKLAEWIGENMQDELGFPDKADQRAEPGSGWTPAELNHILQSHVVDGALTTFGCVEWESELCRGVMRARCYPFDMPKHRFHGMNPKVKYIDVIYMYMHITYIMHTHGIYNVHICIYLIYLNFQLCCVQDTILVIPPYPYCIEEAFQDVQLEDCWYARLQLLFTCYLRPTGRRPPKNANYRYGPDDRCYHLVFFSTFEELKLPISGPMEHAGVTKLYGPFPTPCLYVAPARSSSQHGGQSSPHPVVPGW